MTYYELFSRMKNVTRYSGDNLIQPERLESHIIEMIGLAFDLCYGVGGFDMNKLVTLIAIHDIDETVTVDIPRPFKYFNEEFRVKFEQNVEDYLRHLGISDEFIQMATKAKEYGLEGKIVRILDLIQVRCKLTTELKLGNSLMVPKLDEVNRYIESLKNSNPELNKYINYFLK